MTVRSSLMMRCRAVGKGGTYTCDLLTSKWFHEFQRRTSISYIKFQLLNTLFLSANPITHVRKGGTDEQSAMRNAAACASEGCTTMTQRVWPHTHTHTHTDTHRHTDIKLGGLVSSREAQAVEGTRVAAALLYVDSPHSVGL